MTATERARSVDGAGLAAFRIAFGALMVAAVVRFVAKGWVSELYLTPTYHFTYLGFDWVRPWPGNLLYVHFALMGLSALALCVGLFTRASAFVFFALFTYAELLDKASYLNHYYLVSLLALLLVFVPSNAVASFDAWRRRRRGLAAPTVVPTWAYLVLRVQVGVVYFYAGFAKLNPDWLLSAEPLRSWLPAHADVPVLGPLLASPALAFAMSWGGALFDLAIVPLLLWRRSRRLAYAAAVVFHVSVWLLFPIGVFPWVMLVAASVFFDPAWPRRLLRMPEPEIGVVRPPSRPALALLALYIAVQVLVPLRFLLFPGNANWTEEAFRFSWRVMLIEKSGSVEYRVVTRDGQTLVRPRAELTRLQTKMLSTQPDMIHQYALELARRYRERTGAPVSVYADAWAALNGRHSQRLIDPGVDLASQPWSLAPKAWIVPLATPRDDEEIAAARSGLRAVGTPPRF